MTNFNQAAFDLIGKTKLGVDPLFKDLDGQGQAIVVLDTGINGKSPAFGSDLNKDGWGDRIVYQYDFANNDNDASDKNGHGSNVTSIAAASTVSFGAKELEGIAPKANIIALKVFTDSGIGSFTYIEKALQWVVANTQKYNIAAVNMSFGDNQRWEVGNPRYGIGDELATLNNLGVTSVAASGNNWGKWQGEGVSYPAADKSVLSVGAVFDRNSGAWSYGSVRAFSSKPDQITPFSQRGDNLDLFAPGAAIVGAGSGSIGGTSTKHGTSQASPFVAGSVAILQNAAQKFLNRKLSPTEIENILKSTAKTIRDGDDENDNARHTEKDYKRLDLFEAVKQVYQMGGGFNPPPVSDLLVKVASLENTEGDLDRSNSDFVVSLNQPSVLPVRVSYNSESLTATSWSDFRPVNGVLTFNPGETSKTISVAVNGDTVYEADETFKLNFKTPGGNLEAIGTIKNDDLLPTIYLSNAWAKEGNSLRFGIGLTNPSSQAITVDVLTGELTAKQSDFKPMTETITFSPGQTWKAVEVQTVADQIKEPTETFTLELKNSLGASILQSKALGFIMDSPLNISQLSQTNLAENQGAYLCG